MIMLRIFVLSLLFLTGFSMGVVAQDAVDADFDRRLDLAKEMHEYVPTAEKVNQAIDSAAMRLPPNQQEAFKSAMRGVLNYRVIEKISIDAMAETFTVQELEVMLEYNKKPEVETIQEKYREYEAKVSPEVARMLDKAMMRVRTGGLTPQ